MKTYITNENALGLITDYYKQIYLAEKLAEMTSSSNDFYPSVSVLGESLFGPEPDNGDSRETFYSEEFDEFAFNDELSFGEKAAGYLDKMTRFMEAEKNGCTDGSVAPNHTPRLSGMSEAQRKKHVINILEDSVIWYNVSAGLRAVNASYSVEFNNKYGFEPEEQYNGQTMAYELMGADNDDKGDLLFTLFNAAVHSNNHRPEDRKANAKELANEIYKDWAIAMYGNTKLSTV